jgi:tellurite resistance protein TehA-like permease
MNNPDGNHTNVLSRAAADLFPGYFALVMATGIISIACFLLGMNWIAIALLILNVVAYVILWLLLLMRLVRFFPRVRADINNHVRGPGFFTTVAGTCVLGSQLLIVANRYQIATVLWVVGMLLWIVIMYACSGL